jgi:hypothetical protein
MSHVCAAASLYGALTYVSRLSSEPFDSGGDHRIQARLAATTNKYYTVDIEQQRVRCASRSDDTENSHRSVIFQDCLENVSTDSPMERSCCSDRQASEINVCGTTDMHTPDAS